MVGNVSGAYAPFRPRRGAVVAKGAAGASFVVFAVVAVMVPSGDAGGFTPADRIGTVGLGLLIAAVLWRYAVLRAIPSPAGLRVVNLVRTQDVEWSEIVSVGYSDGAAWVVLELADTEELAVMAIQRADGKRAQREAARLAALVAHHSTPGRATGIA